MRVLKASVRRLVEFVLRSGDFDRSASTGEVLDAMQAGSAVHRKLQAEGGDLYQAEVSLSRLFYFPGGAFVPEAIQQNIDPLDLDDPQGFALLVEGRADGIIDPGSGSVVIDEIKTFATDLESIGEPYPVHVAQAQCYAYLYLRKQQEAQGDITARRSDAITIRMTYASLETGELTQFESTLWFRELETWFLGMLERYHRFAAWQAAHLRERDASLAQLDFPYAFRAGQRELVGHVANAITEKRNLYIQAPTGSGKTLSMIYPSLKAMGEGKGDRFCYLTAKGTARQAALGCFDLLESRGLRFGVIAVTARDKICPIRNGHVGGPDREDVMLADPLTVCNPRECPFAHGHYDRINDAVYKTLCSGLVLRRADMEAAAQRWQVCPYELQLELADWLDGVVCDYNYAFRPASSTSRAIGNGASDPIYLVDEAHNLPGRVQELYSASLESGMFSGLARELSDLDLRLGVIEALENIVTWFSKRQLLLPEQAGKGGGYARIQDFDTLPELLERFVSEVEAQFAADALPRTSRLFSLYARPVYFLVLAFLAALERIDEKYTCYEERLADGELRVKVFCLDPSGAVAERLEGVRSAVFFSGTLLPMPYYRAMLAAGERDYTINARSCFDPSRRLVLLAEDVTSAYKERGAEQYACMAAYVARAVQAYPGNYLVFSPSYRMLGEVADAFERVMPGGTEVLRQTPAMTDAEREAFIAQFLEKRGGDSTVGFCVLGGFFGEGIDLPGDALVGVVIIGTGLPQMSAERALVRDYHDTRGRDGFAYAFTYPGFNKVLQAAGRLIRTEQDRGVVLLLDKRFCRSDLQELFPREWQRVETCTLATVSGKLSTFWGTVCQ